MRAEFRSLQGRFHGAGSACVTIPGSFPTKAPGVGRYVHYDVRLTSVSERGAGPATRSPIVWFAMFLS
jgi:hypothetical protein